MARSNRLNHDMDNTGPAGTPTSLEELIELFRAEPEGVVWRGQANFMWPAIPTLYRRLRQSGYVDSQINESLIITAEERMLDEVRQQSQQHSVNCPIPECSSMSCGSVK